MPYRYRVQTVCTPIVYETWTVSSRTALTRDELARVVGRGAPAVAGVEVQAVDADTRVQAAEDLVVVAVQPVRAADDARQH